MDNINKKEYPDYFKVIKNPTSFNKVLGELDTSIIIPEDPVDENLERLYEETKLIFSNAQSYNDPNSLIHQDSLKLEELFEDKFQELRTSFIPEAKPLKFKIPAVAAIPEKPEPKKRGRKKKVVVESEPEESENDSDEDDIEDEEVLEEGAPAPEVKEEEEAPPIPTLESNVMGRTQTLGSTDEVFIKDAYIASSASTVSQILSQTQEFNNYRASQPVSRYQLIKDTLFSNATDSLSTLIEYKFPSNGYCTQSYTFSLPSDSSSYITMKFNLHDYLFGLKEEDIRNGQSFAGVASDEEFQCKLFVNDNEVENGSDSDDTSDVNRLRLSYDLKLSFGLNIVTFECKVSPSVSKLIKKSSTKPEESEEVAGRHTRHQLQQMKRSWEVEKYTFFIICNSL
ncbi:hypothetical protein CANTEDRAFT_116160 [Yamadazyma tenuis ATCC 10573]|nr:uncharacterized protein CANTEDRAFT_116160 [Yamadazyma tenuis ATCC 10573]EGV61023.1 hypothetical protein CANTEDRAFT_116160 [Yamadazyma tenuis ATCC 10573]